MFFILMIPVGIIAKNHLYITYNIHFGTLLLLATDSNLLYFGGDLGHQTDGDNSE